MESNASVPGSRQSNLKKSFSRSLRCLLTACSADEFRKAFPSFTASEQERLHQLLVQVVSSLHQDIEEQVESILLETQVSVEMRALIDIKKQDYLNEMEAGTILDTVEELVEEQNLDPLHSEKSNVGETAQKLSEAKKNEANHLLRLIEKSEEQKRKIKACIERLKKEKQQFSGAAANLSNELRNTNLNYESGYCT